MKRRLILAVVAVGVCMAAQCRAQVVPRMDTLRIVSPGEKGESATVKLEKFHYVGSPVFSPDGKWIAFDGYQGAENFWSECWIVQADGKQPRKLSAGATPRWSPDGKELLFMREKRGGQKGPFGIFIIQSDGTGERRLGDGRWPDWSPDGKKVVFSTGGQGTTGGSLPMARVCVMNLDGSGVEEICIGDCPSWSPDGKKIACCFHDPAIPTPLIRLIELQTKRQSFLGVGWFRANWSADSQSLYATGLIDSDQPSMLKFSIESGSRPAQFMSDHRGLSPYPSRDGKRIVFAVEPE
jgi:Tol biopolymer transport system component